MFKNLIFVSFFIYCLFSEATAQETYTISGYITDAQSGESLISASVFEGENKAGTVANLYGFYSITLPKDSVYLNFSYIGYEPQLLGFYLNKDIEFNVGLKTLATLDVVEIIASETEKIEEKTEMSVIEIPVAQIKKMPALLGEVDVLKTLQLLPGVQSGGEGQSGLYVRGGSPDQNLILLDGVPVYNVNHLFGFFSVFNADAIKDVKLTKGGFPARYGGRLSSVLEINMKEGNNQEFHGAGSIGLISSKLSLEGPIIKDRASFIISGRRTYIDLLTRPIIKSEFRNSGSEGVTGYYFYDLNAKVNYKFSDKDRLYLSAYTGKDEFYFDLETKEENYTERIENELGWGNVTTALRWNHKWSNKMFSNLTGTYTKYNFRTLAGIGNEEFLNGNSSFKDYFKFDYDSGIQDYAMRLDFDYIPSPKHFIKYGLHATAHEFSPGLLNIVVELEENGIPVESIDTLLGQEKISAFEYNAFIEDDFKLTNTTKINFGFHFSGFNLEKTNYTSLQPRISIRQLLPGNVALKASFSTMRQYVQYLTNENIGLPWDQWLPTTERIIPQDAYQGALGFAKTFKNQFEVSIEAYYKQMDNLVAFKEGSSFFNLDPWEDLITQGQGKSYGLEFFVQKKKGKFTGWIGYTLSRSDRQFNDKNSSEWYPYKFDRRHDLSIVALYEVSKRINLSATWVYGTGNSVTLATASIPAFETENFYGDSFTYFNWFDYFENRNNFRYESYQRFDINIDFIKQKKRHKRVWSIGAYNALNRKNPFFLNFETETESLPDGELTRKTVLKQYSLFPIIPSVTYRFEF